MDHDYKLQLMHHQYATQLIDQIREAQTQFKETQKIREKIHQNKGHQVFYIHEDGLIYMRESNRFVIPRVSNLIREILIESHKTLYTMHLVETKMLKDLKTQFWWKNMRCEIAKFV